MEKTMMTSGIGKKTQHFGLSATESVRAYPIAESTCINGLEMSNTKSTTSLFRWGDSPISPKSRMSGSHASFVGRSSSGGGHQQRRINNNMSTSISNFRCDPHVYMDVQSKGFASRIVKYENGARLSRSMSTNCLYTKPGQFPVVHLKKNDLPYKATKQPVSMTRIAPPEKSTFYGNTLSGLLRSNSVLGLQNSDDNLSHENRPILHPNENDMAPTRSVLDVLKEISRKRINSDELNNGDITKKYCSRNDGCVISDNIDTGAVGGGTALQHNSNNPFDSSNCANNKRQRESVNMGAQQKQHDLTNISSTSSNHHSQSNQSAQCSPEQLAKRRLCSYNNDISSSLSSSKLHVSKRKLNDYDRDYIRVASSMDRDIVRDDETRGAKMLRQQQTDVRLAELKRTVNCANTPITPIPDTPILSQNDKEIGYDASSSNPPTDVITEPLQHSLSTPTILSSTTTTSAGRKDAQKPKLTLFNKDYDEIPESDQSIESKSNNHHNADKDDDNDRLCSGIAFVKPKKSSAVVAGSKNPLIERAQKSKLALMLSGLRGELYQGQSGDDELDKPAVAKTSDAQPKETVAKTTNNVVPAAGANDVIGNVNKTLPVSLAASTATITNSLTTLSTTTSTSASTVMPPTTGGFKFTPPKSDSTTTTTNVTTVLPTITTPQSSTQASPLVGLKLTPQTLPTATITTTPNTDTTTKAPTFTLSATPTTTITSNALPATTTVPSTVMGSSTAGGFSFGLMPTTTNTTTLTSQTSTNSTTTTNTTTSTGFNMLNSAAGAPQTTPTATFSFGSVSGGNLSSPSTTTNISNTPSMPSKSAFNAIGNAKESTINFGSNIATAGSGTSSNQNFTFGTPNTSETSATPAVNAQPKTFTFGSPAAITAAATTAPPATNPVVASNTLSFGSKINVAPTQAANATFQFGSSNIAANSVNTTTNDTTATTKAFTFGAAAVNKPAASVTPTAGAFSFNAAAKTTPSTAAFTFGSNNNSNINNAPATQQKDATPSAPLTFAFGAANKPDKPAPPPAASNSGGFSFGGAMPAASANVSNTNLFEAAASNPAPIATGVVKPSFSFGSSLNQSTINNNNNNNEGIKSFGSISAAGGGNNNTFGALAATTNNGQQAQNAFVFGGNANTKVNPNNANTPATTNVFNTSAFSFGSNTLATNAGSGGGMQMNKPTAVALPTTAFSFGGANNAGTAANVAVANNNANNNITTTTPFSFGAANPLAAANKTFNFCGNQSAIGGGGGIGMGAANTSMPASNTPIMFGASNNNNATAAVAATPAPAFNFTANANANNNGGAPNTANIFAPQPSTERVIRKATRRLQKS